MRASALSRDWGLSKFDPAPATVRRTEDVGFAAQSKRRERRLQSPQMRTPDLAERTFPATKKVSLAVLARCYATLRPGFSATRDAHCLVMPAMSLRWESLHPRASPLRSLAAVHSVRIE